MNGSASAPTPGRIVVGVDGSPESRQALRWAAAEARLRGARLSVVHVWGIPFVALGVDGQGIHDPAGLEELRRAAQGLVSRELSALGDDARGIEIEEAVAEGAPAQRLLESAQGADLLVLGAHGRRGPGELRPGSVSQECAALAFCPTVLVPAGPAERRQRQPPQPPWQSRGRTRP